MSEQYGTIYWINPTTQNLELLVAKPYQSNHLEFFGDYNKSFMGLMPYINETIETMNPPSYKYSDNKSNISFIYIDYQPALIKALNGLREYLNSCLKAGLTDICETSQSYRTSFVMLTIDEIKPLIINMSYNQKGIISKFDTAISNLNKFHTELTELQIISGQKIFGTMLKYKNKKNAGKNDSKYLNELENEHKNYLNSLKPQYQEAVKYYTANGYLRMNQYLRGELSESQISDLQTLKQQINNLNQVLANVPPIKKTLIVYRGMKFDDQQKFYNIKPGQIVDLFRDSFNSTSFKPEVSASNYFTQTQCCIFILTLPPGTKGLYVGKESSVSHEDELILAPGPYFRVYKYPHESVPMKGLVPSKPDLRYYRLMCINCPEAYIAYQNKVNQQLVGPGLAVAELPSNLAKIPSITLTNTSAPKKIMTKNKILLPKYQIGKESHLLIKHSKIDDSNAKITQIEYDPSQENVYVGTIKSYSGTYTGEILNGKPNGMGKQIYTSGSVYEGQYVNGLMDGIGKLTKNNIIYEGKFKNDAYVTDIAKQTFPDGTIVEGMFSNGKPEGKISITDQNGEISVGNTEKYNSYSFGYYNQPTTIPKLNGIGTWMNADGEIFDVDWVNGQTTNIKPAKIIKGEKVISDGSYKGELYGNIPHGYGRLDKPNGDSYVGYFLNSKYHGKGQETLHNGNVYIGDFKKGVFDGIGKFIGEINNEKNVIYEGTFTNGKIQGSGKLIYTDGNTYIGEVKDGVANGIGESVSSFGAKYKGQWKDDRYHGDGQLTDDMGVYIGKFKNGNKSGIGEQTYINGDIYLGQWVSNAENGFGKKIYNKYTYEGDFAMNQEIGEGIITNQNGEVHIVSNDGDGNQETDVLATKTSGKVKLPDGGKYEGDLINGNAWGIGRVIYSNNVYDGYVKKNIIHGPGVDTKNDGFTLSGYWVYGNLENEYIYKSPDGDSADLTFTNNVLISTTGDYTPNGYPLLINNYMYVGELKDNMANGEGNVLYENGDEYEGKMKDNMKNGKGTLQFNNGDIYKGQFKNDKMTGNGIYHISGKGEYDGQMVNNKFDGRGKWIGNDGEIYEGEWKEGKRHGEGLLGKVDSELKLVNYDHDILGEKQPVKKMQYKNGLYTGLTYNGMPYKHGFILYKSGSSYEGDFENGIPHGNGIIKMNAGKLYNVKYEYGQQVKSTLMNENQIELNVANGKYFGPVKDGAITGIGKVIYENGKIYEGEISNGIPHGKGKIVDNGIIYEGNFSYGEKYGKGIETNSNGKKYDVKYGSWGLDSIVFRPETLIMRKGIYKGELQNGLPSGQGTFTYNDGTIYIGEFKEGKKSGTGSLKRPDGTIYNGEFRDNQFDGHGTYKYPTGEIYSGRFKDNKFNGYGTLIDPKIGTYTGNFKDDKKHGIGRLKFLNGTLLEGKWKHGVLSGPANINGLNHDKLEFLTLSDGIYCGKVKNGAVADKGTIYYYNNNTYVGSLKNNKPDGRGILSIYANHSKYDGQFKNGLKHGKGIATNSVGSTYNVVYNQDVLVSQEQPIVKVKYSYGTYEGLTTHGTIANGFGTLKYNNGNLYTGLFKSGHPFGDGKLDYYYKDQYVGNFENGIPNGKGKLIYANKDVYTGNFLNGKPDGYGQLFYYNGNTYIGEFKNGFPSK